MLDDFMTSKEAAEYLKRSDSLMRKLCKSGKLIGAVKAGNTWLIPKASIMGYTPGPKGFAAFWSRLQLEKKKGAAGNVEN